MKIKKLLFTAVALMSFSAVANAQFYLTGKFGMSNESGETESTTTVGSTTNKTTNDKDPYNNFLIGAEAGYYFNDNMAVGADITYGFSKTKNAGNKDNWTADNMFHFNPYFRYDFVSTDKISFGLKAEVLLGFGKNKNNASDNYKKSEIGFGILPVLNYKFTSNWSAGVGFGNLYYSHYVQKAEKNYNFANNETKNITNTWNLDLTLQSLTFSVVYTF